MSDKAVVKAARPTGEEIADIVDRTNKEKPSKKDLAALRDLLKCEPDLWRRVGGMAHQAIEATIQGMAAAAVARELWQQEIAARRGGMGYEQAPEIEKMLIDQVLMCWLRLNLLEYQYTHIRNERTLTIDQAAFLERRLSAAQRRYLRATETLARVRKITRQTVALQVNIATAGGQQVNVAGGDVSP